MPKNNQRFLVSNALTVIVTYINQPPAHTKMPMDPSTSFPVNSVMRPPGKNQLYNNKPHSNLPDPRTMKQAAQAAKAQAENTSMHLKTAKAQANSTSLHFALPGMND